MKKFFQIAIELQESDEQKMIDLCYRFEIDENQLFFMILKTGFLNGAKDYKSAFKIGLNLQEEILTQLANAHKLQDIANASHAPANVVEQNLRNKTLEIKDDELINRIKEEIQ